MTGTPHVAVIRPLSGNGPPGYGHELLLEPTRAAVVIVDVQRFFVESLPFEGMRRPIGAIARFLPIARAAGMVVVHVKSEFRADMADAGRPGSRTRQMLESVGQGLRKGSAGAEIVPGLAPLPEDLVVVKRRFSGFADTELHARWASAPLPTNNAPRMPRHSNLRIRMPPSGENTQRIVCRARHYRQ